MTEEAIAPLDAYVTAKPDEPTFTLQGGDPLAAPLVRLWSYLARARAGVVAEYAPPMGEAFEQGRRHSVSDDERERDNLLLRATAAEEVSWAMDAYVKGHHDTDRPTQAADTHLTELQRLDLHDLKVRTAQRLSNFASEIIELKTALVKNGWVDHDTTTFLTAIADGLRECSGNIEPRRLFK